MSRKILFGNHFFEHHGNAGNERNVEAFYIFVCTTRVKSRGKTQIISVGQRVMHRNPQPESVENWEHHKAVFAFRFVIFQKQQIIDKRIKRAVGNFQDFGSAVRAAAVDLFPRTANIETVVLLSRETNPLTVEVRMEVETGEVKEHPTYKRIQEYVQEKYGFKVHTAYIAEVKRMVGLDMHKAPNAVEQRKHEYHPCPPEKVEAIKDALRHFGLIAE